MGNNDVEKAGQKVGVLLMTYGSATTAPGVRAYMDHIYRGKAPEEIVEDFEQRYRLVGGSPLVKITEQQASALENFLNKKNGDKNSAAADPAYIVRAGMLHSEPFIESAVRQCKDAGATQLRGIILSPQFSSFIMDGYRGAFSRAAEACGFVSEQCSIADPWPTEPHFIRLLADRIRAALAKLRRKYAAPIPVIFTTHSLPKRVVDKDPSYLGQLKGTTDAVLAELAELQGGMENSIDYYSAYQSAGHTPEEWLKPDLTDSLAKLASANMSPAVLIVPIQFLTDHLEILYDLDIAARKQCEDFGIAYHRIELANTTPLFIEALAEVVKSV